MGHVFISYSHTDTAYAYRVAEALHKKGFEAWIDQRLDYGSQWPLEIQKQLDTCDAFLVIMTPRSFASEWVQSELSRAKRKQKPIFPLLLEGDEPWLTVESTQFIDVRGGELPSEKLYQCLEQAMAGHRPAATPGLPTSTQPRPKPVHAQRHPRAVGIIGVFFGFVALLGIGFWAVPKFFSPEPVRVPTNKPSDIDPPVMVTIDDAYALRGSGIPILDDKAYESQPPADVFKPGTEKIFVSLKPSDRVVWTYDWCAVDASTLKSNLKAMKVQFILNGSQISGLFLAQLDYETEDMSCHSLFTALHDWPPGVHHLTIKTVITKTINDGADDYEPGEYFINYTVTVKP